MALTGQQFEIRSGDHVATIVEVGAGLRGYDVGDVSVVPTYPADALPPKGAGSTLVPWPNRIRDGKYSFDGSDFQLPLSEPSKHNASHGLARWVRWGAIGYTDDSVTLATDLVPQTGWPFEVRVEITYAVDDEDGLTVAVSARNTGNARAPFGIGFHPYLSTRGWDLADVTLTIPGSTRLLTDDAQIPVGSEAVDGTDFDFRTTRAIGATRLDDAYTDLTRADDRAAVELETPDGGARLWADESYGYLQVFTVEAGVFDGTDAVAVEPMSCPANAFNSGDGLVSLESGAKWSGSWGISPF